MQKRIHIFRQPITRRIAVRFIIIRFVTGEQRFVNTKNRLNMQNIHFVRILRYIKLTHSHRSVGSIDLIQQSHSNFTQKKVHIGKARNNQNRSLSILWCTGDHLLKPLNGWCIKVENTRHIGRLNYCNTIVIIIQNIHK